MFMSYRTKSLKRRTLKFHKRLLRKEKITGDDLTVEGTYTTERNPLKFQCNECGLVFEMKPTALSSRRYLCPQRSKIMSKKHHSNKRWTIGEVKYKVKKMTNGKYKVLSDSYKYAYLPLEFEHCSKNCLYYKRHHKYYKFKMAWNSFQGGGRCKYDAKWRVIYKNRMTTSDFKKKMYREVGNKYKVIGNCINTHTPTLIEHHDKKCPYYQKYHKYYCYYASPDSFLIRKRRCLYEVKLRGEYHIKKTQKQFENEVRIKGHGHYRVKSKYINSHVKVLLEHHSKKCRYYKVHHKYFCWWTLPSNFINKGRRCPFNNISHGEEWTGDWNRRHGIKYIYGYRLKHHPITQFPLHLDFYMKHLVCKKYYYNGTAIEFDGQQHFKPTDWTDDTSFIRQFFNFCFLHFTDGLKDNYCKKHHVLLIRIENRHDVSGRKLVDLVNRTLNHKLLPLLKINK